MSETWLTDFTSKLVNITGYNFVYNNRKSKIGGGVCIYSQNDIEYNFFKAPEVIKSIFVEIIAPHGKNVIVKIITKDNKHCYVMGDFNLDLLQYNHHE